MKRELKKKQVLQKVPVKLYKGYMWTQTTLDIFKITASVWRGGTKIWITKAEIMKLIVWI